MNGPSPAWKIDVAVPSVAKNGIALITDVVDRLRSAAWEEHDLFGVHLALEEALMNAIKHGNSSDPEKNVAVKCQLEDEHFEIEISDEGTGFDPADVPDPTDDENLEKPSGRGLMLMRFYMSEVHFNETGNQVRMLKRRGEEPSVAEDDD